MDSDIGGLARIGAVIIFVLFLLWLNRRIMKDTGSKPTLGDEVATLGQGRSLIEGLQMGKTGVSRSTLVGYCIFFAILLITGVAMAFVGTLGQRLLGGGMAGFAMVMFSLMLGGLIFGRREGERVLLFAYDYIPRPLLIAGGILFALGLVVGVNGILIMEMHEEQLTLWQAALRIGLPLVALGVWMYAYARRQRPDLFPPRNSSQGT